MKNNLITFISSIVAAILFWIFWDNDLYRYLPGSHYEGLGRLGYIDYIFAEALLVIPLLFGCLGFFLAKEKRWKQGIFSFFISLIVMTISIFAAYELRQLRTEKAVHETDAVEIRFNKVV